MSDGKKFRFSDRVSFVTEYGGNVFINDKALVEEDARAENREREVLQQQSYQQGWASCAAAKDREIAALQQKLREWQQELPQALNRYFAELERQLRSETVTLAFRLTETIIGREVTDAANRRRILDQVLAQAGEMVRGELFVNPEVAASLQQDTAGIGSGITVISDPALRLGEVRLVGNMGIVDGTFSARLEALREHIEQQFSASGEDGEAREDATVC
ncbi:MAG: FliH/SctL family protein [Victivallales bacterium]|nr:FliH/SctL family protein [Victivallales bacterium]